MACYASAAMWQAVFLWRTLRLVVTLARSKSTMSWYSPQCQEWAVARFNATRARHPSDVLLTVETIHHSGATAKTAVWGMLAYWRSKPYGKRLAA